jgi:hypothetical protein
MRSGFFDVLYNKRYEEQDAYTIRSAKAIYTHANKTVDAPLSAQLIARAAATVWGEERRCQGVQRVLLELMQNTNNHASLSAQGEKHWWLSVRHLPGEKKVQFAFVDFGIGVFESLDNKTPGSKWFAWRTKVGTLLRRTDNAEILELILKGDMHSTVTGHPFRGKGLPGIAEVLQRSGISNLVIVTNDVYADVAAGKYLLLPRPFQGTMVYWELNNANTSTRA